MLHIIKNENPSMSCTACLAKANLTYDITIKNKVTVATITLCKDCYEALKTEIDFLSADEN